MSSPFHTYRAYSAGAPADLVARDIERRSVPYIAVRQRRGERVQWYTVPVTGSLVKRLKAAGGDLATALSLSLRESPGDSMVRWPESPTAGLEATPSWLSHVPAFDAFPITGKIAGPSVVIDAEAHATALLEAARPRRAIVYPRLSPDAEHVEAPGTIVTIGLSLERMAASLVAAALDIEFPEGKDEVGVEATVSSLDFAPPDGETWARTFTVKRDLSVTPSHLAFRARAEGDRPFYELWVRFTAGGVPAGVVSLRLPRKGDTVSVMGTSSTGLRLPPRAATHTTLRIDAHGPAEYALRFRRGDEAEGDVIFWRIKATDYFGKLEAAARTGDRRDFDRLANGMHTDLPFAARKALAELDEGAPLLIHSDTPIAPFELLRRRPAEDGSGPLLGEERCVVRWIADPMEHSGIRTVRKLACLRPEYARDPLPSARVEVDAIKQMFDTRAEPRDVATLDDLDELLGRADVDLLHFAGHANGHPARLALQDRDALPEDFHSGTRLLKNHPFFFVNGCRAGHAAPFLSANDGNLVRALLVNGCSGVVGPLLQVKSEAAARAALCFYEQLQAKKTVGEAVREVRALARTAASLDDALTFRSYVAYASPDLGLAFDAA